MPFANIEQVVARVAVKAALLTCVVFAIAGCSSPLDLDVDRDVKNIDNIVSPTRLTMYYHFGEQGYEAIVTNQELLKTILIDKSAYPCKVTIPQFLFNLTNDPSITATPLYSPFIRTFSFSVSAQPADGFYRNLVNANSWMAGEYIDIASSMQSFNWVADNAGREIRIGFFTVADENLVKGFVQFLLVDPASPRYVQYRALITMEY